MVNTKKRRFVRGMAQRSDPTVIMRMLDFSLNIIPMMMVMLGSLFFNECPYVPMMPIWLIVGGSLYLFTTLLDFIVYCQNDFERPLIIRILDHIVVSVMLIWLILGSIWLYADTRNDQTCHPAVYYSALFCITGTYVTVVFLCLLLLLIAGMVSLMG